MRKIDLFEAISGIDDELVEKADTAAVTKQIKYNNGRAKWGAMAACLCLIVASAFVLFAWFKDGSVTPGPDVSDPPNLAETTGIQDDMGKDNIITLDAEYAQSVFEGFYFAPGDTLYYETIFTKDIDKLGFNAAQKQYLPIFTASNSYLTEKGFKRFINSKLDFVTSFCGDDDPSVTIHETTAGTLDDPTFYMGSLWASISAKKTEYEITGSASYNLYQVDIYKPYNLADRQVELNGHPVSISLDDSEKEILDKLTEEIRFLNTSLNYNFDKVSTYRICEANGAETVFVYLYSQTDARIPNGSAGVPMSDKYIRLKFEGNKAENGASATAYLAELSIREVILPWSEYYTLNGNAKMISLEEAEDMLRKGYYFGGHCCSVCCEKNNAVISFDEYDAVDIEYVTSPKNGRIFPFYAFYKYIETNGHGIKLYGKVYVSAVGLDGLDGYFEAQKQEHWE